VWRQLIEPELHLVPREVKKGPGHSPGAFLIATSSVVWVVEGGVGYRVRCGSVAQELEEWQRQQESDELHDDEHRH
jgi:hypothetical protein